ncbi:hypothetical protein ACWDWO_14965 [Actinopolymorpha singaporensis]
MSADVADAIDRLRQSIDALRTAIEALAVKGQPVSGIAGETDVVKRLRDLSDLHRDALISDQEFEDARGPLLSRLVI